MKRYTVHTNHAPCIVSCTIEANGEISFFGECPQTKTKYFSKKKKVNGLERIEFFMPLSPKHIEITIVSKNKIPFKVQSVEKKPLPPPKIRIGVENHAFCKHIFEFCQNFKKLDTGIYTNNQGKFPIVLSSEIKDRTTGEKMNTPARISRVTGQIEVSQEKFKNYTVPMQVFILMHERSHYELQTSDELECDLQAIQWYLGFGFPPTEAIFANTKIFSGNNPEHIDRAEQLYDYIQNYSYKYGSYDNGFLG